MNLKEKGLSAYCAHCVVWNSLLPIEWFGYPLYVYDLPRKPEDPCKIFIFKDHSKVSNEYFIKLDQT